MTRHDDDPDELPWRDAILRPESDEVRAARRRRIGADPSTASAAAKPGWFTPEFRAALDQALALLADPGQAPESRDAAAAALSGPMIPRYYSAVRFG